MDKQKAIMEFNHEGKFIECVIWQLDDANTMIENAGYKRAGFSIRNGKVRYDITFLANNSCGLYYCLRFDEDSILGYKRAVEPLTKIKVHYS